MERMVLVTYATRYGSTAEIAQAVAETLNRGGISSICKPIPAVRQVDEYRAVVLGAPLFMGRLHSDAAPFSLKSPWLSLCPVPCKGIRRIGLAQSSSWTRS